MLVLQKTSFLTRRPYITVGGKDVPHRASPTAGATASAVLAITSIPITSSIGVAHKAILNGFILSSPCWLSARIDKIDQNSDHL
jgi:hypothetical protein